MNSVEQARQRFRSPSINNTSPANTSARPHILSARVDELAKRLYVELPPKAKILLNQPNLCIAGGYVRDRVCEEPYLDIDFFVIGDEMAHKNMLKIFCANLKGYKVYESERATTFFGASAKPVQLIKRSHNSIAKLLEQFDFTCCKMALHVAGMGDPILTRLPGSYEAAIRKELEFTPPCFDINATLNRVVKFKRRGYSISEKNMDSVLAAFSKQFETDEEGNPY